MVAQAVPEVPMRNGLIESVVGLLVGTSLAFGQAPSPAPEMPAKTIEAAPAEKPIVVDVPPAASACDEEPGAGSLDAWWSRPRQGFFTANGEYVLWFFPDNVE